MDLSKGAGFEGRLRFDLNHIKIKYNSEWKEIPKFETEAEYFIGTKKLILPIMLEDVLFDTGNEAGYCCLTSPYKSLFEGEFPFIKINSKRKNLALSEKHEKFQFFNSIIFKTIIGFRSDPAPDWHNTLNIGIDSIIQFASMIYPLDLINSKCRFIFDNI